MGGEGMPKRMAAHGFLDSSVMHGLSDDVVSTLDTRTGILAPAIGRKERLSAPLGSGAGTCARAVGQIDGSEAFGNVALVKPLDLRKPAREILSLETPYAATGAGDLRGWEPKGRLDQDGSRGLSD